MGNVTVKLNRKGMGDLLRSSAIGDMLSTRMARVRGALPGSTLETKRRPSRIVAIVARGSDFDEANTGDLSRALDLAGGLRGTKIKTPKPRRGA